MPKKTRVVELDIARAVAIMVVVFSHFCFFFPTAKPLTPFSDSITSFGVALFLFISGYVLYLNHPDFTQRNAFIIFLKKECLGFFLYTGWFLG